MDQGSDSDQERLAASLSSEDEGAGPLGSEPEETDQAEEEEVEEEVDLLPPERYVHSGTIECRVVLSFIYVMF